MSNNPNPLTLPNRRLKRTTSLNIRLTADERASVDTLAKMQGEVLDDQNG